MASKIDLLCNASANGDVDKVLILLKEGVAINGLNRYKRTPLQVVKLGNTPLVRTLLQNGANPNKRDPVLNLTVTHDAAREGFVDSVHALIDNGADVNLVDDDLNLPLHLAAREGHLEVVRLLLGLTADPTATTGLGYTALELALDYKRRETAECIQEYLSSRPSMTSPAGGIGAPDAVALPLHPLLITSLLVRCRSRA
nr:cyclin-dependent kinase 4 inhibitor C [Nothobranchius furzeri]